MDELFHDIQDFLNQEAQTDDTVEIIYELSCELCAEDGFDECQGHAYDTENDVFLD